MAAAFNDEGYINKYVQSLKDALEGNGQSTIATHIPTTKQARPSESW